MNSSKIAALALAFSNLLGERVTVTVKRLGRGGKDGARATAETTTESWPGVGKTPAQALADLELAIKNVVEIRELEGRVRVAAEAARERDAQKTDADVAFAGEASLQKLQQLSDIKKLRADNKVTAILVDAFWHAEAATKGGHGARLELGFVSALWTAVRLSKQLGLDLPKYRPTREAAVDLFGRLDVACRKAGVDPNAVKR